MSSDIEQLRKCDRCHRIFSILSDLFNHICDDEDDLLQSISTSPSTKPTSDNLLHNNKTTINSSSLFDKKSSSNRESLSSKSFKLNHQSSFIGSSGSSLCSEKVFSPVPSSSSPKLKQYPNPTSIDIPSVNHSNNNKSSLEKMHIPYLRRSLLRPSSSTPRYTSLLPSSNPLLDDKSRHTSSAYIYLRNPFSPMRVIS